MLYFIGSAALTILIVAAIAAAMLAFIHGPWQRIVEHAYRNHTHSGD